MAKKKGNRSSLYKPLPKIKGVETKADVEEYLHNFRFAGKKRLRELMPLNLSIPDAEVRYYFIERVREMVHAADEREMIARARKASDKRKYFEKYTPNDEFHHPYIVYVPAGGQNKKY